MNKIVPGDLIRLNDYYYIKLYKKIMTHTDIIAEDFSPNRPNSQIILGCENYEYEPIDILNERKPPTKIVQTFSVIAVLDIHPTWFGAPGWVPPPDADYVDYVDLRVFYLRHLYSGKFGWTRRIPQNSFEVI